jgi:hypothetical protein
MTPTFLTAQWRKLIMVQYEVRPCDPRTPWVNGLETTSPFSVVNSLRLLAMTLPLRIALAAALSAHCCLAQTGTLTFYSESISTKSEGAVFLPKSEQPFGGLQGGWIFDGPSRLARVRVGRFVTFHLSPGEHSFTDAGPTGPSKKALVINVKDGGQYCVRLFARMFNFGVYARWDNRIEEVPCQQAAREAGDLKPIDLKQVDPAALTELDPRTTFPGESQSQP